MEILHLVMEKSCKSDGIVTTIDFLEGAETMMYKSFY